MEDQHLQTPIVNKSRSASKQLKLTMIDEITKQNQLKRASVSVPLKGQQNKLNIRLDSPRTHEACMELGIDIQNFTVKNLQDFQSINSDEDVAKMRYDHYIERLQSDVQTVIQKRKEIIARQRIHQQQMQSDQYATASGQQSAQRTLNSNQDYISYNKPQQSQMNKSLSDSRFLQQSNLKSIYSRTVNYLRKSHDTPIIMNGDQVLPEEDESTELERKMQMEIEKYNKLKEQKQKEAKMLYEEDIKRIKMIEDLKLKEQRMIEAEIKRKKEKEKLKQQLRKAAEERMIKIQEIEVKYKQRKLEEREKIKKRLEKLKERQALEAELLQKEKLEHQEKQLEKRKKIDRIRFENYEKEIQTCQQQLVAIQVNLEKVAENYKSQLQEKTLRIKTKTDQEIAKAQQTKEIQNELQMQRCSDLVMKIMQSEEHFKKKLEDKIKKENEKKKTQNKKEMRLLDLKDKVSDQQTQKIQEIQKRFQKVQDNIKNKRQQEEKELQLKQELRQLKDLDKLENCERKKRKDDYRLQKLMEKEKDNLERIKQIKEEKNFLIKTRQEISQQSKIEKDRIFDQLRQASDTLFPNISLSGQKDIKKISSLDQQKGLKILKKIIQEDQIDQSIFVSPNQESDKTKPGKDKQAQLSNASAVLSKK